MKSIFKRRLKPVHHVATWLAIASFLSGMTEAWAALPEEQAASPVGISVHGNGWVCQVELLQEEVQPGTLYMGCVVYGNRGEEAIDAPFVHLDAAEGTSVKLTLTDPWSDRVEFMGTSRTEPASRLEPGEFRTLPFFYQTDGGAATVRFGYTFEDSSAFNWEAAGSLLRPEWTDEGLWSLAMAALRENVGETWNDVLARFREDCDHLAAIGDPVRRLDRLWKLEAEEALGIDRAMPTLAEETDLERPARAFGLEFTRMYGTGLQSRFREGALGPGWSDNFDVEATLEEDGRILSVRTGAEAEYRFFKGADGWMAESASDPTELRETEGEYVLSAKDGPELRIGKASMRPSVIRDRQGNELVFEYDGDGRLERVRHADGAFLAFTYGADGRLASVTDDLGRTSRYAYAGGRLAAHKGPDGLVTRYRYNDDDGSASAGALRQVVAPDGSTLDYEYDGNGRVAAMAVNGTSMRTEIRRGRLGSYTIVEPNGAETKVDVGSLGQPMRTTDALGRTTTAEYAIADVLEAVTGPTGKRATLSYDRQGRLAEAHSPGGAASLRLGYDASDRVTAVTDSRGHSYRFGYDALGRPESMSFAGGAAMTVEYGARGDVSRWINRRGEGVSFEYDAAGQPVRATWDGGRTFAWTYDARGNCVRAEDSETGAVEIAYDGQDRPIRIVHSGGRGFEYEYDRFGRVAKKTSLDGAVQCYVYDAMGRIQRITDGEGRLQLENEFDPRTGALVRQRYGNGTCAEYEHDLLGRETRVIHRGRGGETLVDFSYEYDADGRIASQTSTEGGERYEYDDDGQLVSVSYPDGSTETFEYDEVGNRVAATRSGEGKTVYEINEQNQVVSATAPDGGVTHYEYDADGNRVRMTGADGTVTEYAYDVENRLVSAKSPARDIDWGCAYDVFGNRVSVTDHGKTTERLYSIEALPSVAAEYQDGKLVARHILAGGLLLADVAPDGSEAWHHADTVASTRLVTDAAGQAVASASYRAFGGLRVSSGLLPATAWCGVLGTERDSDGSLFMRMRNYDPDLGRFLQPDPIGLSGGQINLYLYCGNSPLSDIDPLGLISWQGIKDGVKDWWQKKGNRWACLLVAGVHAGGIITGAVATLVGIGFFIVGVTAPAWLMVVGIVAAVAVLVSTCIFMASWAKEVDYSEIFWDAVGVVLSAFGGKIAKWMVSKLGLRYRAVQSFFVGIRKWLKQHAGLRALLRWRGWRNWMNSQLLLRGLIDSLPNKVAQELLESLVEFTIGEVVEAIKGVFEGEWHLPGVREIVNMHNAARDFDIIIPELAGEIQGAMEVYGPVAQEAIGRAMESAMERVGQWTSQR